TIFGTLFSFFVIVGMLTALFIYNQLQEKFQEEMSERIESVRVELTHKIASFPELTLADEGYLNPLLTKFSSVFLTDIHLFSPDGRLVGTSRPQIFSKNIEGEMMDITAFQALKIQKLSKFVHTEQIGKLKFLSAYIPFFNDRNQLIAYLNLPYFTRQSEITQQLSQIVITIINVFIFLILISFLAVVVIAEQLTKPLAVIREHIQQLQFGEKNKPISYSRRDEIGDLITEYNRMVGELKKSAEMLAQSERESAWRDMAKQVAHEIKNPLTPMKLSVQHLQKTWESHTGNLDEFINHTTENLIEQIDALTVIANEFSHFAKMPQAKKELFNPAEKLEKVVQLFKDNPNYDLTLITNDATKNIQIEMDKEQFTIVFNNLIKNAIQAIPLTKRGKILVKTKVRGNSFSVEISDNGIGISEEIQSHIFLPNFTTKTSGMGIGLSIVKTIMNNAGGEIRFESKQGKGTRFYLEFPVK
ncbi:MAG: sensor histidine kinase, partial [Candidatus Zixiibacteriota bacterium]